MATRRSSSIRVHRNFVGSLSSAVLEWLLILLLFLDALFSYLVTRFARYCKLETPCILCSRLDHILGNEKPGFYKNLVCSVHKTELSSLVFCQIHNELADVHGMCESCLFSFATEKKSNSETYRLLVGKFGTDLDSLINHPKLGSSAERNCTCCNVPWVSRLCADKLIQRRPVRPIASEPDTSLQHPMRDRHLELQTDLKKRRNTLSGRRESSVASHGFDSLSHVGYSELKISSDTESDFLLSDDEDAKAVIEDTRVHKEEFVPQSIQPEISLFKLFSDCLAPEKLFGQTCIPVPSLDINNPRDTTSSSSSAWTVSVKHGHGLEELNWHQVVQRPSTHAFPELISLHGDPSPSIYAELPGVLRPTLNVHSSSDLVKVDSNKNDANGSGSAEVDETSVIECVENAKVNVSGNGDIVERSVNKCAENDVLTVSVSGIVEEDTNKSEESIETRDAVSTTTKPDLKTIQIVGVSTETLEVTGLGGSQTSSARSVAGLGDNQTSSARGSNNDDFCKTEFQSMDSNDSYKLVISNNDSDKLGEDLKLLFAQISSARGLELSIKDINPGVQEHVDESKMSDTSSPSGVEALQRKITIERNESGLESLYGSIVSELEGESVLDRLKRQIEHDRKSVSVLYKELEEERNASAIAANEAMAMITRLQEEKAALHMEALQYLRMMEEQAEYDVEALQKANDLLSEREKDIQDLEADLDFYREKYPDDPNMETQYLVSDSDVSCIGNTTSNPASQSPPKKEESSPEEDESPPEKDESPPKKDNHPSISKHSTLNFDDEKYYISQCLKMLENKLNRLSTNGVYMETPRAEHSQNKANGINGVEDLRSSEATNGITEIEKDEKEKSTVDLFSIENEVLKLNERLEALELDRSFLEHSINSLKHGEEGLRFIEEIASHLRDLTKVR